jgi:general secretion pathway protein F
MGVTWLFRRWRATAAGKWLGDTLVLATPVVGELVRKVAISRFARTLSTLLASGVQLLQALDIVRNLLGNVVLEKVVSEARDNIREGEGIAPALKRSGQFPPLVTHMIAVGERSGQLEQMLGNVADAYDRETSTTIQRLTTLLEPLTIVVMGVAVGFVIFSIMRPIMMMTEMAGSH